ncbi:SPOR domain-containing protein [Succinatimonas hippei]|uniref:SPOR domain-containing protein n=1 Tax=Succinatimonas hippei TaxID=626938 RepID=UPI0023F85E6C|nr:SPOR domain-containing protein [Succinatimonas hippei]
MFSKISAGGKFKDKKKLFSLLLAAIVVILFAVFLLSLSGEKKSDVAATSSQGEVTGELVINQDAVTEPASKRYDYNNVITDTDEPNKEAKESASSPFDILEQKQSSDVANPQEDLTVSEDSTETLTAEKPKVQAVLYCDSFADQASAETQKAKIAFSGVISNVVQRDGTYRLKIGPFPSRDEAKQVFSKLGDNSLVGTCSLVDE